MKRSRIWAGVGWVMLGAALCGGCMTTVPTDILYGVTIPEVQYMHTPYSEIVASLNRRIGMIWKEPPVPLIAIDLEMEPIGKSATEGPLAEQMEEHIIRFRAKHRKDPNRLYLTLATRNIMVGQLLTTMRDMNSLRMEKTDEEIMFRHPLKGLTCQAYGLPAATFKRIEEYGGLDRLMQNQGFPEGSYARIRGADGYLFIGTEDQHKMFLFLLDVGRRL